MRPRRQATWTRQITSLTPKCTSWWDTLKGNYRLYGTFTLGGRLVRPGVGQEPRTRSNQIGEGNHLMARNASRCDTGGSGRLFVLPSSDRSAKESGWVLLAASQRVGSIIKDGDNWTSKLGAGGCRPQEGAALDVPEPLKRHEELRMLLNRLHVGEYLNSEEFPLVR